MVKLRRVVSPGDVHMITHRGNRGNTVFLDSGDYDLYLNLLASCARRARTEILAYCLLPDHVHLLAIPSDELGLRATFSETHRRYSAYVNLRQSTSGNLWQGRLASFPLAEPYLSAAIDYIAWNPVRSGHVQRPQDWKWSSIHAHLSLKDDKLVRAAAMHERYGSFAERLAPKRSENQYWNAIRMSERTGRPLGTPEWIARLEQSSGMTIAYRKRGRKPATARMDESGSQLVPPVPRDDVLELHELGPQADISTRLPVVADRTGVAA